MSVYLLTQEFSFGFPPLVRICNPDLSKRALTILEDLCQRHPFGVIHPAPRQKSKWCRNSNLNDGGAGSIFSRLAQTRSTTQDSKV